MSELDKWFGPKKARKRSRIDDIYDKLGVTPSGPVFPEVEAMQPQDVPPDPEPQAEPRPNEADWHELVQTIRDLRAEGKTICMECGAVIPISPQHGIAKCTACRVKANRQFRKDNNI